MRLLRALLAVIWLLFGLSATAHALPEAQNVCHMGMKTQHAPMRSDQGVMPCCSQPVVIAPEPAFVPQARKPVPIRLSPAPASIPAGLSVPAEPRPPRNA
jgi:hypothetical protein